MSARDNIDYQGTWSTDEAALAPFGFEPDLVTDFRDGNTVYSAKWKTESVIAPAPLGPWRIIRPDNNEPEPVTTDHWKVVHPGIQHVSILDWHALTGTYDDKNVRWSRTQNRFVYDNNCAVIFPTEEEGEAAEVSQLLESSRQTLERTATKVTPSSSTTTPQKAPETPRPELTRKFPTAIVASTSKGKQPTTTQQPTPPVSWLYRAVVLGSGFCVQRRIGLSCLITFKH